MIYLSQQRAVKEFKPELLGLLISAPAGNLICDFQIQPPFSLNPLAQVDLTGPVARPFPGFLENVF